MELTNMLKEAFRQRNLNLLAANINKNGGNLEVADLNSIIENLTKLAEKGNSFGEEKLFIRLDVLRLLGSLNGSGRLVFKVLPETIRWSDDSKVVTLGGYLVEVRDDGTEVIQSGFSCGGAALEDVYASEMMSDNRRMSSMLSLASARAEKAAFQNAGIGIEFKGDVFDLEASEAMLPAPKPVLPDPVSQNERTEKKKAKAKERKEKEARETKAEVKEEAPVTPVKEEKEAEAVAEAVPEAPAPETPDPAPETAETVQVAISAPEKPEADPIAEGNLTLEEALKCIVDKGPHKGQPLSVVNEKMATWRHLVWLKKNPPEEGRDKKVDVALDIVIASHPELERFL